jgi:hypothetical protein
MDTSDAIEQTGLCFHAVEMPPEEVPIFHPQANRDARLSWRCAGGLYNPKRGHVLFEVHEQWFFIQYRGVSSKYTLIWLSTASLQRLPC